MSSGGRRQKLSQRDDDSDDEHRGNEDTSCWTKCCMFFGIACCVDEDAYTHKKLAEVVQDDQRTCTDVPCLLVLIAVFISQIVLISYADDKGADTAYLIHGTNWKGKLCNGGGGRGDMAAWVDLTVSYKIRRCVDRCSETKNGTYFQEPYPSNNAFDRFCIPKNSWLKDNKDNKYNFDSAQAILERGISDLDITKWLILGIAVFSVLISFIYVYLISKLARVLVYLSIFIIFVGLAVLGSWLCVAGVKDMKDDETETMGQVELAFGIITWIVLLILFLSFFWCRKRIELAFDMLEQASLALLDMPSTLMFPLIYTIFVMGYFALWILLTLYLFSVQKKKTRNMPDALVDFTGDDTYIDRKFDKSMKKAIYWDVISLVYIMQVLQYFGYTVLAGVFSDWYFSEWDSGFHEKVRGERTAELSERPISESFCRIFKYHIGSIAFGALVITPIRIIRAILYYIQAKTKDSSNCALKCMLCCVQCCLKCCQDIIDAINKEGFILTTIWGSNYCYSGITAVKIITKNLGRAVMVEGITEFMEIFGRICIASISTGLAVVILYYDDYYQEHVSSVFVPIIVIFGISLMVGSLFLMVYEVAVDAIFMGFLIDEQVNNGTPRFAHPDLQKCADKAEKRHKEQTLTDSHNLHNDETEMQGTHV